MSEWAGSIRATNGVVYDITPSVIVEKSLKVTRQICTKTDELQIGTTCSAELDVSLYLENVSRYELMNAVINLRFRLQLGPDDWEEVPIGTFTVTDPPERSLNVIKLSAFDAMVKFNKDFGSSVQGRPWNILAMACSDCGVTLGTSQEEIANMPNGNTETYNLADVTIYTYRDLVGFIASFLCCFAYIGADGKLYLKHYGTEADRTITEGGRFEYKPKDYEAFYTSLTAYFAVTQEYERVVLSGAGLDYNLGANPFIQFNADALRTTCLRNIITKLAEVSYTPFTAKIPCDPSIMVGDVLNFTGNHAVDGKLACVTKQVIKMQGEMEISCGGDDPNLNVLTATEKKIQNAAQNNNKDGMYYYDFINAEEITIGDGQTATVLVFNYVTTKRTHIDFHGEFKAEVSTTEIYSAEENSYTENDGRLEVTYLLGGDPVTEYYPIDTDFDGTQLFHLLYTWWASGNIVSSFIVLVKAVGCSVTIDVGASRGYIAGVGLAGEADWDGNVYIYDDFTPISFGSIRKELEDEVSISKATPAAGGPGDNLGIRNFARTIMKGMQDAVTASNLHRFTVLWNDGEVTKDGVHSEDGNWVNDNPLVDGTLTTPAKAVDTILTVTSHHAEQNGDVTFLASFDEGSTWWSYSGGWVQWSSGHGMAEPVMHAIPQSAWDSKLNGTIMMRAILEGDTEVYDIQIYTEAVSDQ